MKKSKKKEEEERKQRISTIIKSSINFSETVPKISEVVTDISGITDWIKINSDNNQTLLNLHEKSKELLNSPFNENNKNQLFSWVPKEEVSKDSPQSLFSYETLKNSNNDWVQTSDLMQFAGNRYGEEYFGKSSNLVDSVTITNNIISDAIGSAISLGESMVKAENIVISDYENTQKYLSKLNYETGLVLEDSLNILDSGKYLSQIQLQERVFDLEENLQSYEKEIAELRQKVDMGEEAIKTLNHQFLELQTLQSKYETVIHEKQCSLIVSENKIPLLILGANYELARREVYISTEVQTIQDSLKRSNFRDNFKITTEPNVMRNQLQPYISQTQPKILLCIGHGTLDDGMLFCDDTPIIIKDYIENTYNVLSNYSDVIKIIILNICQSTKLAEKLKNQTNIVIGTTDDLDDDAAIEFSNIFFNSFANGDSFLTSFKNAQETYRQRDPNKGSPYEIYSTINDSGLKEIVYNDLLN